MIPKRTGPKPGSKHKNARNRKFLLPPGESGFNKLYASYVANAKKAKRIFELSKTEFRSLVSQPCFYCGISSSGVSRARTSSASEYAVIRSSYSYTGLDRIDNTKGYTIHNSLPCCFDCNRAKSTLPLATFLNWVGRLITHNQTEL